MEWTARQREQIILHYAHEGVAFCPNDMEPLVREARRAPDVKRQGINLRCPRCGRQSHSPAAAAPAATPGLLALG
jgi:hypothetical protein